MVCNYLIERRANETRRNPEIGDDLKLDLMKLSLNSLAQITSGHGIFALHCIAGASAI